MKSNTNGQDIYLNLDELIKTCSIALRYSKDELNKQEKEIQNYLDNSYRSKDYDTAYRNRCNAMTHTTWLVSAAEDYKHAISMYFYCVEAKERSGDIHID